MNKKIPPKAGMCEDCEFYDYDEIEETYYCRVSMDQDERAAFSQRARSGCPYYRPYDEYKSVHRQI